MGIGLIGLLRFKKGSKIYSANSLFILFSPLLSYTTMNSNMSPQASVRRGPTLRGGRFRPPIGRNSLIQRRNSTSSDEEEKLGLTENIELVNLSHPAFFFY